jgi:hypothetical protein
MQTIGSKMAIRLSALRALIYSQRWLQTLVLVLPGIEGRVVRSNSKDVSEENTALFASCFTLVCYLEHCLALKMEVI